MPQIQASLNIQEHEVGPLTSVIRLGMIGAFFLAMLSDRIGRRRLLMITIIGSAIATLLTSFVQTKTQFMVLQATVRIFSYAEDMLCIVVIAEEFDARARGWAIGALSAMMAIGVGLASVIFALVNLLPFGWRAIYVIGALPLFLIAWYRRGLKETSRFEQLDSIHRQEPASPWAVFRPAFLLIKEYPLRMLLMAATVAPIGFALGPQPIFMSKYLQEVHGFTPGGIMILFLTGGLISITGSFAAGKASDLIGRRVVFMAAAVGCAIGFATFYAATPLMLVLPAWVMATFCLLAVDALVSSFGAELFPTSHRATASAVRVATSLFAGAAGLALEGSLYTWLGSHGSALTALLFAVPLAVIAALSLPDAARRELEEVSPEKIEVPR
jgi:putative MFS transporter